MKGKFTSSFTGFLRANFVKCNCNDIAISNKSFCETRLVLMY
uniref:Uncharacterized protein n=1 Tax=Manihot esculenta TaxID=3983 RepID=A0A2C9W8K1_MANES